MVVPIRLAFSGRFDFEQLDVSYDSRQGLLSRLQEHSVDIASDIQQRLFDSTGFTPEVQISFTEGSIEWHGLVQWAAAAWPTIEVMAGIGGAIQLVQMVRSAVDSVLQRWFGRMIQQGPRRLPFPPSSRVVVVSLPSAATSPRRMPDSWSLFGIAAVLIGIAAIITSIGYVISAIR